jgi:NCAIR mutase (PurE)-related protein
MSTLPPALLDLMSKVLRGEASSDELLAGIRACTDRQSRPGESPETDILHTPGATVDLGRKARCGFGEVIYGEGKSAELITQIIQAQLTAGQPALVTRVDAGVAFQVRQAFANARHNPLAKTLRVCGEPIDAPELLSGDECRHTLHAAVVTAGSTDLPVAEEAVETLAWMGVAAQRFEDIGVAGPQRLAAAIPQLRLASAVVVVAGMEGALPAVVAAHLPVPVFAVPTSVGYGASLAGVTAMMGMLSSCVANVAVVNVDAGFKGGFLAGLVVAQLQRLSRVESRRDSSVGSDVSEGTQS